MQKITFSFKRTLALATVGILGTLLNIGVIIYVMLPSSAATFALWQRICLAIGVIIVSSALQIKFSKLIKKHMVPK